MTSLKIDMRNPVLVCGPMKFLLIKLTNIRNRNVLVTYTKRNSRSSPEINVCS